MRRLNYELWRLQKRHPEGSYATRQARLYILAQAATALHALGYRGLGASGLKPKHVEGLIAHWRGEGLTSGTMKNRLAHVRWWAEKIGKMGVVRRDNESYGIGRRRYVTNEDRSRTLDGRLEAVRDPHVRVSLRLQEAFGLRREEAIKFSPSYADRGDGIELKASWTKGGKARSIALADARQREALEAARSLAGKGSLIPGGRNYRDQLKRYENETARAGLSKMHGLRHAYAQRRYEALTGWKAPAVGGPRREELSGASRDADEAARLKVSQELGHERVEVVAVYLGS